MGLVSLDTELLHDGIEDSSGAVTLAEEVRGTELHSGSGDDDGNQVNMGPAGDNSPLKKFIDDTGGNIPEVLGERA